MFSMTTIYHNVIFNDIKYFILYHKHRNILQCNKMQDYCL